MNSKTALTNIIISALLISLLAGLQFVEVAEANFYIPPYETAISIISPQNTTYNQNTMALNFTLESNGFGWYWYGLDNEELIEINVTTISQATLPDEYQHSPSTNYRYTRVGNAILGNLSEGIHTLTVVELSSSREIMTYANVTFKIDTYALETNSRTIVVPDDYPTIQAAINASIDGDTVFVKKGVYIESPIIDKLIMLVGEDRNTTVIYAGSGLRIKRANVTLTGFTIHGPAERGISLESDYCNISNNKVTNVTHGLFLFTSKYNTISGNIFESIGSSSAIQLNYASDYNLIENNYISSCTEGIQIWLSSGNNTVTKNTITNCKYQAIRLLYSNHNVITFNNIASSGIGVSICVSNGSLILNNNFIENEEQLITDGSLDPSLGYGISVNAIDKNYWNDYNGTDANDDGIGDTQYIIDPYNQDSNPLILPINSTTASTNPIPTTSNSPSPSSSPNPTLTPSTSSTQQPSSSPTPPLIGDPGVDMAPALIMWGIIAVTIVLGVVAYFNFKKRLG